MSITKKSKLPPVPKRKFPLHNLLGFRRNSIGFLKKIADEYGDIVYFSVGPIKIVFLNHPDTIKEVLSTQHQNFVKGRPLKMAKEVLGEGLLTSEGEYHQQHFRTIQPAFHRKMIESYAPAVTHSAIRMMSGWEEGTHIDIMEEMMKMSAVIAAKAMFNADVAQEASQIVYALTTTARQFGKASVPFSEWLLKLPLPATIRFNKAKKLLDNTIKAMVDERRRNKLDNGDLVSILLHAQEAGNNERKFSEQEVHDEALTLFLTAFDTTSTALNWTWYLLSQHPKAEMELHEEVDRVLRGRIPTADDISNLPFTRMVFAESLRMYPPSYIIAREALQDFQVGQYIIPGGTLVLMSPYLIQRDARFHSEPEQFNPHNWEGYKKANAYKYAYFPFGGGPRSCIGESFAWMEAILVLATVAQSWRLQFASRYPVELQQLINLRPKNGMPMTVHHRN